MTIHIPAVAFDQHIIVLGKTRSGKSSVMRVLVEYLLDRDKPVTIVDPKGDWWGLKSSSSGKSAGYPVVIFGGEHGDVPLNAKSGATVGELLATGNRSSIIDLGGWMPGDRTQFWIDFASTYFRMHRGRHYLVIDEVHNLCPKGKIMDPNAGKMLHWSNRLASEGLGKGISMIAASQRPQKVHNDFLTSCETLLGMRVIHKADRDAISDWIDGCADPEKAGEVLRTIASMKRGEAWAWSPEADFGPKRIQFEMFKTYDSFKPQPLGQTVKLKGWADVDLAAVRKKLESVVKEAEAKDPEKLKARIRELERQAKEKLPTPNKALPVPDHRALERAIRTLRTEYELKLASQARIVREVTTGAVKLAEAATRLAQVKPLQFKAPSVPRVKISTESIRAERNNVRHTEPARPASVKVAHSDASTTETEGLTGPQKKILTALSQLRSIGKTAPPRNMVGAWAGYSPSGGAFGNPLGALKSVGYVNYPYSGIVELTDSGLSIIGEIPAPDEEEIRQHIESICTGPELKIFRALIGWGREEMAREELAERSGYREGGGAFGNPLGALRTKGLLDYPRARFVKAAEWLFVD